MSGGAYESVNLNRNESTVGRGNRSNARPVRYAEGMERNTYTSVLLLAILLDMKRRSSFTMLFFPGGVEVCEIYAYIMIQPSTNMHGEVHAVHGA